MGKLPGFYFYPGDWMKDPELRSVSSEARGLWIDMLCLMFESQPRGYLVLRSNKSVTPASLARMTGNFEAKVIQWIEELEDKGVLSRDDAGTIFCRKMVRDQGLREDAKERMRKMRERNNRVTSLSPVRERVSLESFEVASKESDFSEKVLEVAKVHPATSHLGGRLSRALEGEICEALARDGYDLVLSGTRNLADAVSRWPAKEKRFIPNAVKFYRESEYMKDPEVWSKDETENRVGGGACKKHPESGLTPVGTCWECYAERFGSAG